MPNLVWASRRTAVRVVAVVGLAIGGLTVSTTLAADLPDHAIVPAFERLYSAGSGDESDGGRILLGELNCLSCHKADAALQSYITPKQAPVLTDLGNRIRPDYLRQFINDPHHTKPGTTMPNVFEGVSDGEKKEQVEALVHFLASTGRPRETGPQGDAVKRGEDLFHKVGCVACHDPRRGEAQHLPSSVPLGDLAKKYSIPALTQFLQDPLKIRPSGRMPHLNLNPKEAGDIASYLLKDIDVEILPNVKFSYYEGSWQELPDFSKLKPKTTGVAPRFDVTAGKKRDQFGMVFEAFLNIDRKGKYTFHLGSDDGSRLLLDGNELIRVDGVHPFASKSRAIDLEVGVHEIVAEYFEQGGEEVLKLEFEGGGMPRQPLDYVVSSKKEDVKRPRGFVVKEELASKGRKLFASVGCASCHTMQHDGKKIESALKSNHLAALKTSGGCLAATSKSNVPRFQLSDVQRTALSAAIESVRKPPAEPSSADELISHTMATFNCYACHQHGEIGGVETARNALFLGNQPEMGDEGRIPPLLTGVGAKLKADWMKQVFNQGAKDRPYMFTRMPRFGANNVGQLIAALEETDKLPSHEPVKVDVPSRRLKASGRILVGDKGSSCIKCHTFRNIKATGIQSISMTTMTKRLKQDWFEQYMLDPAVFRPGTRMPAAWPNGQSFFKDVLDGDAKKQIHAVWMYLADGDQAAIPLGLGSTPNALVAKDEAIIYRNFIENAGPRAIGVGYPEKANLAFDANEMRIALLWHGGFIDASKHWNGRGQGFQPPLGDNILRLPAGTPLAVLTDESAPWPTKPAKEQGYRFRGYRLVENRRPVLLYSFENVRVEDYPAPAAKSDYSAIIRKLSFTNPVDGLWYRAAVADKIEAVGDGWYTIDNDWKVRLESSSKPNIRKSGNKFELLVPVKFDGKQTQIIQEYSW